MAPATELANKLYSFIASGDIPQLLEYLSDDIVWTGNASSQDALSNIPFAGPFHGKLSKLCNVSGAESEL